ncbi:MAG: hypothetical protein ACRC68_12360 [Clostridium sp.]
MKNISVEFIKSFDSSLVNIFEITNLDIKPKSINYHKIKNTFKDNKIMFLSELIYKIEYIDLETSEVKYVKVIKNVSEIIKVNNPVIDDVNIIENVIVSDKSYKLLGKSKVLFNVLLTVLVL